MNQKMKKRIIAGAGVGLASAVCIGAIVSFTGLKDASLNQDRMKEEEESYMEEEILGYSERAPGPRDEVLEVCTDFAEQVCERSYLASDGREGYELLTAEYRATLEKTGDPEKTAAHYRENELVQNLIEVENAETISVSETEAQAAVSCRCRYGETAAGFVDLNGVGEGEEFTLLMFMGLEKVDGQWKISGCNVIQC